MFGWKIIFVPLHFIRAQTSVGDSIQSPLIGKIAQIYFGICLAFKLFIAGNRILHLRWYGAAFHCTDNQNRRKVESNGDSEALHYIYKYIYEMHKILRPSVMHHYKIIFIIQCHTDSKIATQWCPPLFVIMSLYLCPRRSTFPVFDSWAWWWYLTVKNIYISSQNKTEVTLFWMI